MIRLLTIACFGVLAIVPIGALPGAPAGAAASATLVEAALAPETTNDGKSVMVPDAGQAFLWVTARMDAAAIVDLTKVSVVSGATTFPLLGVSLWDGDPVKFSMIVPVHLKSGKLSDPLEESSSAGSIAFVFTPGKTGDAQGHHAAAIVLPVVRRPESLHGREGRRARRRRTTAPRAHRFKALTLATRVRLIIALSAILLGAPEDRALSQPPRLEYRVVFASAAQLPRPVDEAGREGYACVAVAHAEPGTVAPGIVVVLGRTAGVQTAAVPHRVIAGGRLGSDLQPLLDRAGAAGFRLCGVVLAEGAPGFGARSRDEPASGRGERRVALRRGSAEQLQEQSGPPERRGEGRVPAGGGRGHRQLAGACDAELDGRDRTAGDRRSPRQNLPCDPAREPRDCRRR